MEYSGQTIWHEYWFRNAHLSFDYWGQVSHWCHFCYAMYISLRHYAHYYYHYESLYRHEATPPLHWCQRHIFADTKSASHMPLHWFTLYADIYYAYADITPTLQPLAITPLRHNTSRQMYFRITTPHATPPLSSSPGAFARPPRCQSITTIPPRR